MDRYCTSCGKKANGDELYCDKCGTKLETLNNVKIEDEVIIEKSESNILCLIWPVLVIGLGIFLAVFFTAEAYYYWSYDYYSPGFVGAPYLFISLIGFIWFIIRYIAFSQSELILTNKNVRGKCGVIFKKEMESPLNKISSVYISSGLIGNLLGYGTIGLATDSVVYKFKFISHREYLKSRIFKQIQTVDKERIVNQAEEIAKAINKS